MKSVVGMQGYKGRILQKNFDGHMKKVREALDKVVLHAGKKWYDTPEKIAEKMYRILDKYLGVKKTMWNAFEKHLERAKSTTTE